MKKRQTAFILLAAAFLVAGCSMDEDFTRRVQPDLDEMRGPGQVEPGRLIVKMKSEPEDPMELAAAFPDLKVISVDRLYKGPEKFEARKREMGLHLWYTVLFDQDVPVTRAASDISAAGDMEVVSYVYPVQYASDPYYPFDDPQLDDQWHYMNFGTRSGEVEGSDINLFPAWEVTTGREDVIVAVTDGGVDYSHEDLAANMWVNEAELYGQPGVDDDGNGYVDDIYGYNFTVKEGSSEMNGAITPEDHGTHVAGTIAAVNNNGIGVSGIAGGDYAKGIPGARIMSCQTNPGSAYIQTAFIYAADNGAVISQNSWSVDRNYASTLAPAMDYFIKYAGLDENRNQVGPMAGGIIIFAAANESTNQSYPADADNVFAVASIGADYEAAYYTNYGSWVEVSAPGGDANKGKQILSTLPGNKYGLMQGTSMACPHVSGVAALVVSAFGQDGFTNEDCWDILLNGTRDIIYDYNPNMKGMLGTGLIDADICMKSFGVEPPDAVDDLEALSSGGSSVVLQWTVPSDIDSYKPTKFNVFASPSSLADLDPSNPGSDVVVSEVLTGKLEPGDVIVDTVYGLTPMTEFHFRVQAEDNMGSVSDLSNEVVYSTLGNTPPVITPVNGTEVTIKVYESARLDFNITDVDKDELTYELEPGSTAVTSSFYEGTISVVINGLNAPKTDVETTYKGTITVTDGFEEVSMDFYYTIIPNSAPELVMPVEPQIINSFSEALELDMSSYFRDADNEVLAYTVSTASGTVLRTTMTADVLRITANAYGMDTVTVTASDAAAEKATCTFVVLSRDGGRAADFYPNPVVDTLNVRTGEAVTAAEVTVKSASGATVFSEDGLSISPFAPAAIDMTSFAGGMYKVTLTYTAADGSTKTITTDIAKL